MLVSLEKLIAIVIVCLNPVQYKEKDQALLRGLRIILVVRSFCI